MGWQRSEWTQRANKFKGKYQDLQDRVLLTGFDGEWRDLDNGQKQYRCESGAVLNWWATKGTLLFQGPKSEAQEFEAAFHSVEAGDQPSIAPPLARKADTKIFVVHGHDTRSLEQLELILRRLGLDPYILQNNDGHSKTLVEALELQIYEKSAFGIILMTPDDYGYAKTVEDAERQPRARQNVILEMGMVMASLG